MINYTVNIVQQDSSRPSNDNFILKAINENANDLKTRLENVLKSEKCTCENWFADIEIRFDSVVNARVNNACCDNFKNHLSELIQTQRGF